MLEALSILAVIFSLRPFAAFAEQPTPPPNLSAETAAKNLEKAKTELQRLKDVWDRTRLEATLYDKRAQRAYQQWAKSKKKQREQARIQKEKAQLEYQLAIERRKLAFSQWQAEQYRVSADEFLVKALDQEKETRAIKEKIRQLEGKLKP